MRSEIKIKILGPGEYLKADGTFDMDAALDRLGKVAAQCYSPDGLEKVFDEPKEKTLRRIQLTLENEHHSVYEHVNVTLNIQNIPKILAMMINNEKQYATSEKSGRYTEIVTENSFEVSDTEKELYTKWVEILKIKIKNTYGNILSEKDIEKLAFQEARAMVTVFMPTDMVHSLPLAQLNKIVAMMDRAICNSDLSPEIQEKLKPYFNDFIQEIKRLNLSNGHLQSNKKERDLSLFKFRKINDYFDHVYQTNYQVSFTALGQLLRHRTLHYEMTRVADPEFYVPKIIQDEPFLVREWMTDITEVAPNIILGEKVSVNEMGRYDAFVLKLVERLCTTTQLEAYEQTLATLHKYLEFLRENGNDLYQDLEKYTKGARCLFGYKCSNICSFPPSERVRRRI